MLCICLCDVCNEEIYIIEYVFIVCVWINNQLKI